jgi:uncharacterized glyoxalase superfamily protein PhnB
MSLKPYLLYEDVAAAQKFLAKAFGFRRYGPQNKGPDGTIYHGAMQFGDDVIMMGYPGPTYKNPKRLRQATHSLYIMVDDVDKHFACAKKAGASVLEEPQDTFYGHRRYGVADPEGHEWYFAQEIPRRKSRKSASKGSRGAA